MIDINSLIVIETNPGDLDPFLKMFVCDSVGSFDRCKRCEHSRPHTENDWCEQSECFGDDQYGTSIKCECVMVDE